MNIKTAKEFYSEITNKNIFERNIIDLDGKILEIKRLNSQRITFNSCTFNCDSLNFLGINNLDLSIEFIDCTFNCSIKFENCNFQGLTFLNTKSLKALKLFKGFDENNSLRIGAFNFTNKTFNKNSLDTKFSFGSCIFLNQFTFENINHIDGFFDFYDNILGSENKEHTYITFYTSKLFNCNFVNNIFQSPTQFHEISFTYLPIRKLPHTVFRNNTFGKLSFSKSNFDKLIVFAECDFLSTAYFGECKNIQDSEITLVGCEFKGFSLFNKSTINFLNIDRCTFAKSVSFNNSEFNKLRLFEVKFEKGAFFDEMKINNVFNKEYLKEDKNALLDWKKTLRTIKLELQKTENRIDYNHYKAFELEVYNSELSWSKNFNDKFTLVFYRLSSFYGTNWRRALIFTIASGIFWFVILYRIENSGGYNLHKINDFFNGLFRFFLITDFYNPLKSDRIYLNNSVSWIPLIFGKLFIAFGLYEMIQSFRKFRS